MRRRSWALDVLIAGVVMLLGQLEAWYGINATHRQGPHWAEALVYGVTGALLVLRRVRPLRCIVLIAVAYVTEFAVFGSPEGNGVALPTVIAAYSVARWEAGARARWGLVTGIAIGVLWTALDPASPTIKQHVQAGIWISPFVIAWLVGALVRSRRETVTQRRLEREQRASRAVAEERNRIARELHDVIGHSVSVMTVQASAVRRRLTTDQVVERQALETVEAVGRQALTEMRHMVGVLRQDGDHTDREPPPGLAQIDLLVGKFAAAGLPVTVLTRGEPVALAPGLDLTAFRLIQEGLTNTLQHAMRPTRAEVSILYRGGTLELSVSDDGQPVPADAEPGHGLLGMRERVSVYGGTLVARPRPGAGFELVATLPVEHATTLETR